MSPKKPRGRPKGAIPSAPVTGFRIPVDLLARLDKIVAKRNAELASVGGEVSRTSVIVAALRAACDAEGV